MRHTRHTEQYLASLAKKALAMDNIFLVEKLLFILEEYGSNNAEKVYKENVWEIYSLIQI